MAVLDKIKKYNENQQLTIFFVYLTFLQPRATDFAEWLDLIYKIFLIAVFLYCGYVFAIKKRRLENKFSFLMLGAAALYESWYVLAALLNGQSFVSYAVNAVTISSLILLTAYFAETNLSVLLRVLCLLMNLMVVLNASSYLWIQEGHMLDATENTIYFWNTNNHLISLYLVAFALNCMMLKGAEKRNKYILCVLNAVIFLNLVCVKVTTALMGIVIFIALYLISCLKNVSENKKIAYLFHPYVLCFVGLMGHILVVFCRIQNMFSWLIVDILHKSLTLTGRTNIWDIAIELIKKKPIIGYGYAEIVSYHGFQLIAHNQFLDIMAQAGIIGLVFFLGYAGIVINRLYVYRTFWTGKIIISVLFSYLIMMITERVSPFKPFYIIFVLACYIPELEKRIIQKE